MRDSTRIVYTTKDKSDKEVMHPSYGYALIALFRDTTMWKIDSRAHVDALLDTIVENRLDVG